MTASSFPGGDPRVTTPASLGWAGAPDVMPGPVPAGQPTFDAMVSEALEEAGAVTPAGPGSIGVSIPNTGLGGGPSFRPSNPSNSGAGLVSSPAGSVVSILSDAGSPIGGTERPADERDGGTADGVAGSREPSAPAEATIPDARATGESRLLARAPDRISPRTPLAEGGAFAEVPARIEGSDPGTRRFPGEPLVDRPEAPGDTRSTPDASIPPSPIPPSAVPTPLVATSPQVSHVSPQRPQEDDSCPQAITTDSGSIASDRQGAALAAGYRRPDGGASSRFMPADGASESPASFREAAVVSPGRSAPPVREVRVGSGEDSPADPWPEIPDGPKGAPEAVESAGPLSHAPRAAGTLPVVPAASLASVVVRDTEPSGMPAESVASSSADPLPHFSAIQPRPSSSPAVPARPRDSRGLMSSRTRRSNASVSESVGDPAEEIEAGWVPPTSADDQGRSGSDPAPGNPFSAKSLRDGDIGFEALNTPPPEGRPHLPAPPVPVAESRSSDRSMPEAPQMARSTPAPVGFADPRQNRPSPGMSREPQFVRDIAVGSAGSVPENREGDRMDPAIAGASSGDLPQGDPYPPNADHPAPPVLVPRPPRDHDGIQRTRSGPEIPQVTSRVLGTPVPFMAPVSESSVPANPRPTEPPMTGMPWVEGEAPEPGSGVDASQRPTAENALSRGSVSAFPTTSARVDPTQSRVAVARAEDPEPSGPPRFPLRHPESRSLSLSKGALEAGPAGEDVRSPSPSATLPETPSNAPGVSGGVSPGLTPSEVVPQAEGARQGSPAPGQSLRPAGDVRGENPVPKRSAGDAGIAARVDRLWSPSAAPSETPLVTDRRDSEGVPAWFLRSETRPGVRPTARPEAELSEGSRRVAEETGQRSEIVRQENQTPRKGASEAGTAGPVHPPRNPFETLPEMPMPAGEGVPEGWTSGRFAALDRDWVRFKEIPHPVSALPASEIQGELPKPNPVGATVNPVPSQAGRQDSNVLRDPELAPAWTANPADSVSSVDRSSSRTEPMNTSTGSGPEMKKTEENRGFHRRILEVDVDAGPRHKPSMTPSGMTSAGRSSTMVIDQASFLPSGPVQQGPEARGLAMDSSVMAQGPSPSEVSSVLGNQLPASVEPAVAALPSAEMPSESPVLRTAASRLQDLISGEVVLLQRLRTGSMTAVLRPDPGSELRVELRRRQGSIEIRATVERGDARMIAEGWPELQQQLRVQGIHLLSLERDPAPSPAQGGPETSGDRSSQSGGRGRHPYPGPDAGSRSDGRTDAPASSSRTSSAKASAATSDRSSHRLLESWA